LNNYLLILPVAFLVAYSQIIVKWRMLRHPIDAVGIMNFLIKSITDPVILSAYIAALFASFAWLFVVTKLPLSTAFPVYIGITFVMVVFGGWVFLQEQFNLIKLLAITLIFLGIAIGVKY
jgi:multidrug transporter EmrE-like cation transporter